MSKLYVVGIREDGNSDWLESTIQFPNANQASKCLATWRDKFVASAGEAHLPAFYRNTRIMKVRIEDDPAPRAILQAMESGK